ncbi:MAG: pectate lyase [Dyadobacter sp.]|nr:pectate lyase [Dyadobacter sp.]
MKFDTILSLAGLYFLLVPMAFGQKKPKKPSPVALAEDGRLAYASDSLGNRIVDFSYAGYMAGAQAIPDAPIRVTVPAREGDATARIQAAIDYVGSLPLDANGLRGAVLLGAGTHRVLSGIVIKKSGVVIRGAGMGNGGTVLLGDGRTRETVIRVLGENNVVLKPKLRIADAYVPVNGMRLEVENAGSLKVGDRVRIVRPSTAEWIKMLKMQEFGGETGWLGWKPGQRDITWDRIITALSGNSITVDAPVSTALDAKFGGGFVVPYRWDGRISHVGIENLRIESTFDPQNLKDENHRWMGITFENVENAWVRQMTFRHLAGSAVAVYESASKVTVEDCKSLEPVSEIAGQRRNTFFTQGGQTLFLRCYAENGLHDFATGYVAPGPNAFVQCESHLPNGFSGAIDSWASGVLFDIVNVDGNALLFQNRGQDGQGAGWTAANSVFWQCSASRIENFAPPGAQNFAFGAWAAFAGDGFWENVNEHIQPRSLYFAQLAERLGDQILAKSFLVPNETEASSSPSLAQAAELVEGSHQPSILLADWIDQAAQRNPIPVAVAAEVSSVVSFVKSIDEIGFNPTKNTATLPALTIRNGRLVRGNELVTGARHEVPWWRGSIRPHDVSAAKPHITRYVPGRVGKGFTDDLQEMTDSLQKQHITVVDHNYGLWYDRRRDDHERIRRIDGETWPPFYEQPFARSGKDAAWDDLSKYDLLHYNEWYWNRLRDFVSLADQKGLILYHQNYFQHNILEAGAHYADFPWRTANNVNQTGFPEPPPYAGDKRIFIADQFYDISNPERKALHRAYIRQCLDNFADQSGVVQFISAEYTGPLHFVQFWLDVIGEWERERGKNALVGLSTTKDVQDAILGDAKYAALVDIIDIRYWHRRENGTDYAPEGGRNLAPRQHARIQKTGKVSFGSVYSAVLEYKKKYPEKAVLYNANGAGQNAWAVFLAGGSVSAVPPLPKGFLEAASAMEPVEMKGQSEGKGQPQDSRIYALTKAGEGLIIYREGNAALQADLTQFNGSYQMQRINARTGAVLGKSEKIKGGKLVPLSSQEAGPVIYWFSKK